uniref:protein-tyrosine-phosphatase n=1 Tax=Magallana gigas TaxID=29159 RepID=A0A8W8NY60_MAGGI
MVSLSIGITTVGVLLSIAFVVLMLYRRNSKHGEIAMTNSTLRYNDHSRVILVAKCPDYINANYIDGVRQEKVYIATQGPRKNTVSDFWSMVWQERVKQVVMLTNVMEGVKINENRVVTQYHYTAWPDHDTPDPLCLLLFHNHVTRTKVARHKVPTLVHCSAGIGRTGTYIAIDALYEEVDQYALFLTSSVPERENYINAISLPSFIHSNAFIITHYQTTGNSVDFIRLITDYESDIVVCMEPLCNVEFSSDGPWSIEIVEPTLTRTQDYSQTASQFLSLVSFVQSVKTHNPITVVSRDGAALCGVFCAVYNLIQQLTIDEEMDVFSVVRLLQTRRPELCSTLEEYAMIHDALMTYIESNASGNTYYNSERWTGVLR